MPIPLGKAWVKGEPSSYPLPAADRGAYVPSLRSGALVYKADEREALDDALELASVLNTGSPGPAVAGGWAAIEALLVSPSDEKDRKEGRGSVATDRMAAIVTCSWPGAEIAALSRRLTNISSSPLAKKISVLKNSQERSRVVAEALLAGEILELNTPSDRASASRMANVMKSPGSELIDVQNHVTSAMRRLYRHRNIVMHGGTTDAAALRSTLRTVAPLVGAGLDRIVYAAITDGTDALSLSDRAQLRLKLLKDPSMRDVTALLE